MPGRDVADQEGEHSRKPAKALRAYFGWLVGAGEIKASSLRNVKRPRIPEESPAVLTDEQLTRLLKACEGNDFE